MTLQTEAPVEAVDVKYAVYVLVRLLANLRDAKTEFEECRIDEAGVSIDSAFEGAWILYEALKNTQ